MNKANAFVDGSGWISDESDFYGNPRATERLEKAVNQGCKELRHLTSRPVDQKMKAIAIDLTGSDSDTEVKSTAARRMRQSAVKCPKAMDCKSPAIRQGGASITDADQPVHFPRDGDSPCGQSTETIAEFITRLRPSTANDCENGPWIWITDSCIAATPKEGRMDEEAFMRSGQSLLDGFLKLKTKITLEMDAKAKSIITRKVTPHRTKLEKDLRQVAVNSNCVFGKWLLFPQLNQVDNVWRMVVEAVTANKLGPVAKVATGSMEQDSPVRLICVYTKDFSDSRDVRRVLDALVELELVKLSGPGIYYKSDAYTLLGINSGNVYGLPASIYKSKDMLGSGGQKRSYTTGFEF